MGALCETSIRVEVSKYIVETLLLIQRHVGVERPSVHVVHVALEGVLIEVEVQIEVVRRLRLLTLRYIELPFVILIVTLVKELERL